MTRKGFGEYAKSFKHDGMDATTRFEILAHEERIHAISQALCDGCRAGPASDDLVVVLPVDQFERIEAAS